MREICECHGYGTVTKITIIISYLLDCWYENNKRVKAQFKLHAFISLFTMESFMSSLDSSLLAKEFFVYRVLLIFMILSDESRD